MTYLTGFHAIEERIKSGKRTGALLVAKTGPRGRNVTELAQKNGIALQRTGQHELDARAPGNRGVALEVDEPVRPDFADLEGFLAALDAEAGALVIVLDEITDPHNYGAILRCADQFGADLVVSRSRRSAKNADIIGRTSAGAASWVPQAEETNLPRALEQLKQAGFWVYGADMAGESLYGKELSGKTALVLGGESGLSRLLKASCDALLSIPSYGKIDSLNVSVAAGVFLYEIRKQRALRM
ncbi:MAG: 23S rRNA (guanosine(2251)-2'-O)-methyltransferase RlmB [Spirochaetaceae bacterium]|jgi:23S rRNA (guanosine2251-2'-O)-methyltransferase|nr:23S rRNA (guanosine(2251)-2'-O)-methyltransferase RlmB [Spirochaetaceae bacterium]